MELTASQWLEELVNGGDLLQRQELSRYYQQLDQNQALQLLAWWLGQLDKGQDLSLIDLLGRPKGEKAAQLLRLALLRNKDDWHLELLMPLLGYQRETIDFFFLANHALQPGPLALRRAALEGVARGLSSWPLKPLRHCLLQLGKDLQPLLAIEAIDLLARLPWPRQGLNALASTPGLDPSVAERLVRRRAASTPTDLLLVLHGRAGGLIPAEIHQLAAELRLARGGRVFLQALTDEQAPLQALNFSPAPITLVPLFQLPGQHVQFDVPAIAAHWRSHGWPLRRLPFLGAWPLWQQAISSALQAARTEGLRPLLLHHPLSGSLAFRYVQLLEQRFKAPCQPWCDPAQLYIDPIEPPLLVPLAIAANQLSAALQVTDWPAAVQLWPPLLQQQHFYSSLLKQLVSLP